MSNSVDAVNFGIFDLVYTINRKNGCIFPNNFKILQHKHDSRRLKRHKIAKML